MDVDTVQEMIVESMPGRPPQPVDLVCRNASHIDWQAPNMPVRRRVKYMHLGRERRQHGGLVCIKLNYMCGNPQPEAIGHTQNTTAQGTQTDPPGLSNL